MPNCRKDGWGGRCPTCDGESCKPKEKDMLLRNTLTEERPGTPVVIDHPEARGEVATGPNPLYHLSVEGYETLAGVLRQAYAQAAVGKGHERHANGEPFDGQVMQDMARRFGVGALLGQAFKKSEESQRLPHDAAVRELLGAINYLAGAVIALENKRAG